MAREQDTWHGSKMLGTGARCLAREQDAPTAVPHNKNNAMHYNYNTLPLKK
ncbi:MAG: hypothetical protein F6K18_31650 [Okeania sp. SIO2C2]|uniref:hypothetical protein n=1 Tax=Okeania sp. SIO2C2 TaxID=2607787 RepID=UPI0013BAB56F|nr:hypothetical protein [Okeania sp. SIO2C2]NEP91006.1 hypothetical protein [Okeania sp. SIO2C2]